MTFSIVEHVIRPLYGGLVLAGAPILMLGAVFYTPKHKRKNKKKWD